MSDTRKAGLMAELRPWLRMLARRRRRLWLGAGLMLLTVASAIGLLALSGWFITATAITGALLAAGVAATLDVYIPGGGIRLFAVTRTASRYIERLYNHDTVLRLLADLRAGMFAVMTRLDGRTMGRLRSAEWLNRLTADIDTLDSLYLRLLAPAGVALLAILLVSLLLSHVEPWVGLWLLVALLMLWLWLVVGQAWLGMSASQRRVATLDHLRTRTIEQLQGLAELRCYATLDTHRHSLRLQQQALYDDQRRLGRYQALGNALVGLGVSLSLLLVLWLAANAYQQGELSGPLMVMMGLAVLAMNEALAVLPAGFTHLGATRAAARRLNRLGALRGALQEPNQPQSMADSDASIALENVSLCYPHALDPALDRLSLTIDAGERVALLGESGAGKSSVAQLVARLVDPTQGQVSVAGQDVRRLSLSALRGRIGYLTQHAELFQDSLAANLRLADPHAPDSRLWEMLEIVELAAWVRQLPAGLDTWIGESGRQVSGGQARRIALARVLLSEAEIILLDEPFSGLDEATTLRIAERLDPWLQGRTVLFLAHQDKYLPGVGRSLTIHQGSLI